MYLLYLYTAHVEWLTKCKLVTWITCASHVFTSNRAHTKIVYNSVCVCVCVCVHAKFLSFTSGKHAGTHVYPHAYDKFKLSCKVLVNEPLHVLLILILK